MISIRSKPASLFQAFCSSSIRNRRIRSSLYVEVSSLTRMHSCRRQLVVASSAIIFRALHSLKDIFSDSDNNGVFETLVHLYARTVQGCPKGCLQKSKYPGDTGSCGAHPIDVPPRWRSPSQRSRSVAFGRWRSTALFSPADVLSSAVLQTGDVEFFSHFRLASRGCCSDSALVALLRPVVHTGTSSQCFGRFLGR